MKVLREQGLSVEDTVAREERQIVSLSGMIGHQTSPADTEERTVLSEPGVVSDPGAS